MSHLFPSDNDHFLQPEEVFRRIRWSLGVPEGPKELAANRILPMKANLDFLNFLSFEKGCYTGQELTIRTHHIGKVWLWAGVRRCFPVCLIFPSGVYTQGMSMSNLPIRLCNPMRGSDVLIPCGYLIHPWVCLTGG